MCLLEVHEVVVSRYKKPNQRQLTIYLEPDDSFAIDQWMVSFGLDSRSAAALCMLRAGNSAVPMETAIFEVAHAATRETRRNEFEAMANYFSTRAAMYRGPG